MLGSRQASRAGERALAFTNSYSSRTDKRQVLISPPNFITTARWQTKHHRPRGRLLCKRFLGTPPVAIWSLILAVLSFTCGWLFTAIPAVICGHIARAKIRKSGGTLGGRGIATVGLILGYIALVLGIMGIPLLISMIQSDRERLHRLSTERKEIASDDGKIKVTVPGMWTKMPELNKFASLQVGDKTQSNVFDCDYRGES